MDNIIKNKYPGVYIKMTNKAVAALRKSNYNLYWAASLVLRKINNL